MRRVIGLQGLQVRNQVQSFYYLVNSITRDNRQETEIKKMIFLIMQAFYKKIKKKNKTSTFNKQTYVN